MKSIPGWAVSRASVALASATLLACATGGTTASRPVHTSVRVEPQPGPSASRRGANDLL